ncbi:MAG: nitroreductase family protein [Bacteroidota bacterium]|nr:nitroreductase family protein [Bacteroidota bacterium]
MSFITINEEQCKKCGICSKACPVGIIGTCQDKIPEAIAGREKNCVQCFHCESVCPENALIHELSDKAIVSSEGNTETVSAVALNSYFRKRRSIRNYRSQPVNKAILQEIMDIVRYSPTGHNHQSNQWTIVYDSDVVQQLAKGTIDWMRAVMTSNTELAARYGFRGLISEWEKGNDRICRNAPHLAICCTPADYSIGQKDAVIATAHLELLLPAYGLGGCWAGFLNIALQNSPELKKLIGIDDSMAVHSVLMLGIPAYKYYKTPDRKNADITWI